MSLWLRLGLVLALVAVSPRPAAAATFVGHGEGTIHAKSQCVPVVVNVCRDGEGTLEGSQLGAGTFTVHAEAPPPDYCHTFTLELDIRAADGSTLRVHGDGRTGTPSTCDEGEGDIVRPISGTFTITGGTGRFRDAAGGGIFQGTLTGPSSDVDERVQFDWSGSIQT